MWITLALLLAPMIFDLIYKALLKRYGSPLIQMSDHNVAVLEQQKDQGFVTGPKARDINIKAIKEATRMSPPIPTVMAELINLTCYVKMIEKTKPERFKEWVERNLKWEKKGKKYRTTEDFSLMGLYVSPPDRRGEE